MKRFAAFALAAAFIAAAYAQVTGKDAWIRATAPQQKTAAAYMQISSARDARLLEARSPVAATLEMHETRIEGGMSRMRPVKSLELPAGKTVTLAPGGLHLMLMGLKEPIQEGQSVPLTLVVEGKDGKRESVEVKAAVRRLTGHGGAAHGDHAGHGHGGH